jgi:hypothetical protein
MRCRHGTSLALVLLLASSAVMAEASLTVRFDLAAHTNAVALQFDVLVTGSAVTLGTPAFDGVSPHRVESNEITGGTTRFVVYSTTGLPISPEGNVTVSFEPSGLPTNGMLEIGNILASDSTGSLVSASPNALPLLITPPYHRSAELSKLSLLTANVIDPDGAIVAVQFRLDDIPIANAPAGETSLQWAPSTPGLFQLSARVTDSANAITFIPLGTYRAYQLDDITAFSDFVDIHYGSAANPVWLMPGVDPLNTSIPNGLAYFLGINPHRPDRSRLLNAATEAIEGESHAVFRFVRSSSVSDVDWALMETSDLLALDWQEVAVQEIQETSIGGGLTEVLVRKPLSAVPDSKLFMLLETSLTP